MSSQHITTQVSAWEDAFFRPLSVDEKHFCRRCNQSTLHALNLDGTPATFVADPMGGFEVSAQSAHHTYMGSVCEDSSMRFSRHGCAK